MAIAYVQDTGKQTDSITTSSSRSFGLLPTVGNHVFGLVSIFSSNSDLNLTYADNQTTNTWAKDAEIDLGAGTARSSIGSAKVAASTGTFTIQLSVDFNSYWEWVGIEFGGLHATTHKDQTGQNSETTGTSLAVTASGANSQPNMLVLAVMANSSIDTDINVSHPPSGYTAVAVQEDAATTVAHESCYKIVSAGETSSVSWSFDEISTAATGVLVTYIGAEQGGGPEPVIGQRMTFYRLPPQ